MNEIRKGEVSDVKQEIDVSKEHDHVLSNAYLPGGEFGWCAQRYVCANVYAAMLKIAVPIPADCPGADTAPDFFMKKISGIG